MYRKMIYEHFLAHVLIVEPQFPVSPQEEVDGSVPRE